jgi:hypothetical protein
MLKPEEVDLVLRKNFKNIVDKAAAGRVLTQDERAVLLAGLGDEAVPRCRSWTALAKVLHINRKTIWELRDKHGGPESFDVQDWRDFLTTHADASGHPGNAEWSSEENQKLRAKLLTAQAGKEEALRKLKELELAQKERGLVPYDDAQAVIKKVFSPLRELLDALPKAAAIEANPDDPGKAEQAFRHALDKAYGMLQKEVRK